MVLYLASLGRENLLIHNYIVRSYPQFSNIGMLHKMEGFPTYLLCRSAVKDIQITTIIDRKLQSIN
jgi:hypothetical protein